MLFLKGLIFAGNRTNLDPLNVFGYSSITDRVLCQPTHLLGLKESELYTSGDLIAEQSPDIAKNEVFLNCLFDHLHLRLEWCLILFALS